MGIGARGCTRALRRYLNIYTVCLQFFRAQLLKVIVWAHCSKNCVECLKVAFACVLFDSSLSAVWVATETKHQLHHLIESTITDDCGRGRWAATNMCDLLLLADSTQRTWNLRNIDAKYQWLVVSVLLHIDKLVRLRYIQMFVIKKFWFYIIQ